MTLRINKHGVVALRCKKHRHATQVDAIREANRLTKLWGSSHQSFWSEYCLVCRSWHVSSQSYKSYKHEWHQRCYWGQLMAQAAKKAAAVNGQLATRADMTQAETRVAEDLERRLQRPRRRHGRRGGKLRRLLRQSVPE